MQVNYQIKEFSGKGKGLVADQFIPKGTRVWAFNLAAHEIFRTKEEILEKLKVFDQKTDFLKIQEFLSHIYSLPIPKETSKDKSQEIAQDSKEEPKQELKEEDFEFVLVYEHDEGRYCFVLIIIYIFLFVCMCIISYYIYNIVNHSKDFNCGDKAWYPVETYALRDIQKGEELCTSYDHDVCFNFPSWYVDILNQYKMESTTKAWN
ncbi:nuclear protein SET [Reticulomyxa filosa]|uniref:Nuclear protein SET n=1 Tax=Reticulomyxa filosa TaxID=46433 RepID=X6LZ69_RETFI|nr:nuclear protein SET [Reticulomyxa filosa]|eukprot:ETO06432.1 nuclear protein SET [Reticulomyxa filosa]